MNKIKFRAWDGTKIIIDFKIGFVEGKYDYSLNDEFADPEDKRIYMQYTGLKDKNGKEIYEGDIINSTLIDTNGRVEQIYWRTDLCGWSIPGETHTKYYEVIGNIYENPELI